MIIDIILRRVIVQSFTNDHSFEYIVQSFINDHSFECSLSMDPIQLNPDEVANDIIKEMTESGKWDEYSVKLASLLQVKGITNKAEARCQNIIQSRSIKEALKDPKCNEYKIAAMVERADGLLPYKEGLYNLLSKDEPIGKDLYNTIDEEIEKKIWND